MHRSIGHRNPEGRSPGSGIVTLLFSVVAALLTLYFTLLVLLWHFQERIVFQPPRVSEADQSATPAAARQVRYQAADGADLFAWVVGEAASAETVVLAFHGNAELARSFVSWAEMVAQDSNACVVLAEYRGYDGLDGPPTYLGSSLDALAALAYVRDELQAPASRTVYFGRSLGTAVAAELAAKVMPRALVLEAPFTSARQLSRRYLVPDISAIWRLISRVRFDTAARVESLDAPVWVAHGDRDVVIPVRMGRAVFNVARRQGELLVVSGAGHNDLVERGGDVFIARGFVSER